jgi:methylmalonyl-CoA mutase, C-terminal domain
MTLLPRTVDLLRAGGAGEILILAGGTIPTSDIPPLIAAGIAAVFTPGTDSRDVVRYIREHAPARS